MNFPLYTESKSLTAITPEHADGQPQVQVEKTAETLRDEVIASAAWLRILRDRTDRYNTPEYERLLELIDNMPGRRSS